MTQWILPGASLLGWGSPCRGAVPSTQPPTICFAVPVWAFPAQVLHERLGHRAEVDVGPPAAAAALQRWVPLSSRSSPSRFRAGSHLQSWPGPRDPSCVRRDSLLPGTMLHSHSRCLDPEQTQTAWVVELGRPADSAVMDLAEVPVHACGSPLSPFQKAFAA